MLARCLHPAKLRLALLSHCIRSQSIARGTFCRIPQSTNLTQLARHGSEAEPAARLEQGSGSGHERNEKVHEVTSSMPAKYNCCGCGAILQSANPKRSGFIPREKLDEWLSLVDDPSKVGGEGSGSEYENKTKATEEDRNEEEEEEDINDFFPETDDPPSSDMHGHSVVSSFICKRCFSLKNYNNALNITLQQDDYLRHLNSLKDKRALIVLLLDVTDFPCCVFPDLKNLLSPKSSILIVANKIDLFPGKLTNHFWSKFREHVIEECEASGLDRSMIVGVRFVSVTKGSGILELSQEIVKKWGNRGDVYLLGCTNVGKSSLFNKLLGHLCGSKPGELNTDSNMLAPKATISQWPGTTLGLLSFPLMSVGKRRRLLAQQRARDGKPQELPDSNDCDEFYKSTQKYDKDNVKKNKTSEDMDGFQHVEAEDILDDLNLRRKKIPIVFENESPQNRFWLYDTPGAINEAQLINHLTPKELTFALPKVPLRPRTLILKPGQCFFLGGLARLDYEEGPLSAYFTVFAWSYLNIHATKLKNADQMYKRQLGAPNSIFKLPLEFESRGSAFPFLEDQKLSVCGRGWKQSAVDVVLSSAGWVAVTAGTDMELSLRVHTPGGKGVYVRKPALFMEAVNLRGKRERYGTRTAYRGLPKKR